MSKNPFKNKKFRYGSMSVIFVIVILVLLVAANALFTVLASQFHWYVDMTDRQLYTVSQTTKDLLGGIEGQTVTIKFLQKRDKIEDSTYDNTGDPYLKQIHELALDYEAEFPDLVKIVYVDLYTERAQTAEYISHGYTMTPTKVVFDNGEGLFSVLEYTKFLASDSGKIIGFYGEHRITATILSLCRGKQTAYILSGHGEEAASESFKTLLQSCGYNNIVENVVLRELTEEKIAEDQPRLLVMIDPKTDLVGTVGDGGGKTEKNDVYWLNYLLGTSLVSMPLDADQPYASLMIFSEPTGSYPNLNDVLYFWGMTLHNDPEDLVKETQNNSFGTGELYKILPAYSPLFGSALHARVAMEGAGTIDVFAADGVTGGSYLDLSSGAVNENESFPAAGKSVLAMGRRQITGTDKYNFVFVCADSDLISDAYLSSSSYANESVITLLAGSTTDQRGSSEAVDIEYKDYVAETNVTSALAHRKAFLVLMAAVIPAAILVAGTVIYLIRRNRV